MAKFHSKILLRMMLWNGQIFFLWPRGCWRKMVFIFIFANNIKYLHSYIFWNVNRRDFFSFTVWFWLLAAIMVNLKINSNLPLCNIIVKGNGRWNYCKMQSRHKIKAESTQCSKIGKFCSYKCVQASSCTQRVKW